ncbi:MAG: SRPBCC family protein [Caldilineaceae bacterium]
MISPSLTLAATLYIHAARGAVWEKFCQLTEWPRWNTAVRTARWLESAPQGHWQENARFQVEEQGRFGTTLNVAVVRMVLPNDTLVWESSAPSLHIVHRAHFTDELGGCKLQLRKTYHGLATLPLFFWRGGQQSQLEQSLRNLKVWVERR